ncbi:MAG: hypothetical protein IPG66_18420 [Hydrogenophilales bacterium]|nr:hypothetical protein [Hydrogenophilales bacterium]
MVGARLVAMMVDPEDMLRQVDGQVVFQFYRHGLCAARQGGVDVGPIGRCTRSPGKIMVAKLNPMRLQQIAQGEHFEVVSTKQE